MLYPKKYFLLLIYIFFFFFNLYALESKFIGYEDTPDNQDIPNSLLKVVSLDLENVSCEEALTVIEEKGNFKAIIKNFKWYR